MNRDLSRGDIPTLILAVLEEGACHGYAIAREIERRSAQMFQMREGSLYPALRVLEQDGFIEGRWDVETGGAARKVYVITDAGRGELVTRRQKWEKYVEAVGFILKGKTNVPAT